MGLCISFPWFLFRKRITGYICISLWKALILCGRLIRCHNQLLLKGFCLLIIFCFCFPSSNFSRAFTDLCGSRLPASGPLSLNFRLKDISVLELSAVFPSASLLLRENLTVFIPEILLSTVTSSDRCMVPLHDFII
eukprot:UN21194